MCLYKRKLRSRMKILIVLYRKTAISNLLQLKQLVKNNKAETTTIMSSVGLVITCLIILDTNLVNWCFTTIL